MSARNEDLGKKAAVEELKKEGLNPKFHQLDITGEASITRLKESLQSTYNGLHILVNNAATAYKKDSKAPFSEQAEVTLKTNFRGTLNICNALFPLLRPHASSTKEGMHKENGIPDMAYGVSKICETVMSFILQKQLNIDPREDIIVNSCCPGYVDTDMSSNKGPKTID